MRITNRMMTDNAIQNMAENMERYNSISQQAATQKQFQVASDDPVAASNSLNLRSSLTTLDGYQKTIGNVDTWLSASDLAMDQMQSLNVKALSLVDRGLNDTLSPDERMVPLAAQMDQFLQEAINIGNASEAGQYIFSGYKTDTPPFAMPDANTIEYNGDQKVMQRVIGYGDETVSMNTIGEQAFQPFLEGLVQARNALQANDTTALRDSLTGLQSALDTISFKRSQCGERQQQVQSVSGYLDKMSVDLQGLLSKNENVNTAEVLSNLKYQETAYQSVLEVSQRAISALNLFDYLQ